MDNAVSEDTTDDSEDTDQTDDAGKYKFGFSVIDMQNPYFITLERPYSRSWIKKSAQW